MVFMVPRRPHGKDTNLESKHFHGFALEWSGRARPRGSGRAAGPARRGARRVRPWASAARFTSNRVFCVSPQAGVANGARRRKGEGEGEGAALSLHAQGAHHENVHFKKQLIPLQPKKQ